jgi:hypothetical protein
VEDVSIIKQLGLPDIVILFMHIKAPFAQKGIKLLVVIYSMLIVYQLTPWLFAA